MRTPRLLRGALVALAAGVLGSVAWTLRRPEAAPPAPPPDEPPASASPPATRMDDLVYRSVKGGRETLLLRAKRMAGREQEQIKLEGVAMEFSYVARGAPATGTIVSDECVYFPTRQEAYFQGHVQLRTEDGVELRTEQLVYRGQEGRASSELPVEFRRRQLSGSARSMAYDAERGRLELAGDVFVRLDEAERGALEIRSARAALLRADGEAHFEEEVELQRGGDRVTAAQLILFGAEDDLDRMRATGDVVVRSTGDGVPGLAGGARQPGPRELRCEHLDVDVRPDRSLREAVAKEAVLVALPGPREVRERRTLRGSILTFRWDEQGRLSELLGQKDAGFEGAPLPPAAGPPLKMRSRNFHALLEPATGAARGIEFNKDVEFERGPQRARAGRGYFYGPEAKLALTEEPLLLDLEQGSRLEAETIELFTVTRGARARYGVSHTLEPRAGRGAGFPGAEAETSVLTARFFEYDAAARAALYSEGALLRSGKSELRAGRIRRVDAGPGARRLEAFEGVFTLLYPRARPGEPAKQPVEGRAKQLEYDEAKREIVYTGDVFLVQGDLSTKSQKAVLTLAPEAGDLERLEASDPVELRQAARVATGRRAVYTPAERTIVVTGDAVELRDETQEVRGRSLTFFVGDDRILVDGREEARTETILRKKP